MTRKDAVALLLLAALISVFFADVLAGRGVFYMRDVSQFHVPTKKLLRDIVLSGEFPSWNPYVSAGQPLAANPQHEVFYPLTWLILLPDFLTGFHLLVMAHLYLAAFAMYALLRSTDARPSAAFFGAHAFAMGGLVLSYMNLLPFLFSVAWLPLTLLFARRWVRDGARRDLACAACVYALQLILGEPTTMLQTGLLIALYALFARPVAPRLARALVLAVVATLLAAVQLLPALDLFRDSVRAEGFGLDLVGLWSLPPVRLPELVFPSFSGTITAEGTAPYWGGAWYAPKPSAYLLSIYSGLLLTTLAIAAVASRERGSRLVAAVATLSILVALGSYTPLLALLHRAELATSMRYPEKFILMAAIALIVSGTLALDRLLGGDERMRRSAARIALVVAAVAFFAFLFTFTRAHAAAFAHVWRVPLTPALLAATRNGWVVAAVSAALLFALLRLFPRIPPPLGLVFLGIFAVADLGPLAFRLAPRMPRSFYDPPPVVHRLPADRTPFRIFHLAHWTSGEDAVRMYRQVDPEFYWRHRNTLTPQMPALHGLRTVIEVDYDFTHLRPTADFTRAVWKVAERRRDDWIRRVAATSNAWYAGVFEHPDAALRKARGRMSDVEPVRFLEGRHHPRYFFATSLAAIAGVDDFAARLAADPFSSTAAYVPRGSALFTPAPGRVTRVQETANSARIDVETAGRAFLVMSVTPNKHWRITIDGRETTPVLANVGYQGVEVPAGRHTIAMSHRNPLIPIGAAISVATLAALVLLVRRSA